MRILITGGTGFIGNHLGRALAALGHELVILTRSPSAAKSRLSYPCEVYQWDGARDRVPEEALEKVEAVINMAGEGIADKRWTKKRMEALWDSRVLSTRNLVKSFAGSESLRMMVSFSAIGYYGDRKDRLITEETPQGEGFLSELCGEWEKEAEQIDPSVRLVQMRLGVVLGDSGFLKRLEPIFRFGLGGPLGDGKQYLSWIHIEDLVSFILKAIGDPAISGKFNLVAPESLTNKEFTKEMAAALGTFVSLPAPKFVLKAVFGKMSAVFLDSQNGISLKIPRDHFKYPDFPSALKVILLKRLS